MEMELQYCIKHMHWVLVQDGVHEEVSYISTYLGTVDLEGCTGPFAYCPPPITNDQYWQWLFLQEPDEEWIKATNG